MFCVVFSVVSEAGIVLPLTFFNTRNGLARTYHRGGRVEIELRHFVDRVMRCVVMMRLRLGMGIE